MFKIIVYICCLLYVPFFFLLLRNTFLGFSLKRKKFAGLILGKEIFLLIIPGVLMFASGLYKEYMYFYVTDESMKEATFFALYALFVFALTIAYMSKIVFPNTCLRDRGDMFLTIKDISLTRKLYKITLVLMFLLVIIFSMFGMNHAFLSSIIGGRELIDVRLGNRYSGIPTVLMSFFRFLFYLNAVLLGLLWHQMKFTKVVFGLVILLLSVTYFGDKAPILYLLLLVILAYLSVKPKISAYKVINYFLIIVVLLSTLLFFLAKIQIGNLDILDFFNFMILRAGLGQVGGAYEQFALKIQNLSYIWHAVPFANYITDYPIFNKDLMMLLWGRNLLSEEMTGVANSLFIGEAYAIGGYILLWLSPVIVAFNFCIAALFLNSFLRKAFKYSSGGSKMIIQLLLPSLFVITGDIAGILFNKLLLMILIFLSAIYVIHFLSSKHVLGKLKS